MAAGSGSTPNPPRAGACATASAIQPGFNHAKMSNACYVLGVRLLEWLMRSRSGKNCLPPMTSIGSTRIPPGLGSADAEDMRAQVPSQM